MGAERTGRVPDGRRITTGRAAGIAIACTGLVVATTMPVGVAAREPSSQLRSAHEVRSLDTTEWAVSQPRQVTFDPVDGTIIAAGATSDGTRVIELAPGGDLLAATELSGDGVTAMSLRTQRAELVLVTGREELVVLPAGDLDGPGSPRRSDARAAGLRRPAGSAFDASGALLVLDAADNTIARIERLEPVGGVSRIRLPELRGLALRGLAFNPADGLIYVGSPAESRLHAVTSGGRLEATYDLTDGALADQGGMAFGPSTDPTDHPERMSLFIADAGTEEGSGEIAEMSLQEATPLATTEDGVLLRTIETWRWDPPSPDPSGAVFLPSTGRLLVSDSEVNEMSIFTGVNLYESTLGGSLQGTGTTVGWSSEPTGVGLRASDNTLFVSDDKKDRYVHIVRPGTDGRHGTSDDTVTTFSTRPHSDDPEDVAYDAVSGALFIMDGYAREVVRVHPGADQRWGTSDDAWSSFDVERYGLYDPEGIDYDAVNDTLVVVDQKARAALELTKGGELLRTISIAAADGKRVSGIAVAPSSQDPSRRSLYVTDRMVDNNHDPNENDGLIYEFAYDADGGGTSNRAPVVSSVTIDQSSPRTDDTLTVTVSASDPDGDPLTYSYQWLRNSTAIPGATGATLDLSIAGHGDEGDAVSVRVTASDGKTTSDALTSAPVTVVNSAPVFDQDLADRSDAEGDTISLSATATDADAETLTYAATGLPAGLAIDTSTGLVSGTIPTGTAGTYAVQITVTDGTATATDSLTWTVTVDLPPAAPTGLSATPTSTEIVLDWADDPDPDLAGYEVYRSTSASGTYRRLTTTLLTGSEYVDATAAAGDSHYRVIAVDGRGQRSSPAETAVLDRILLAGLATATAKDATSVVIRRPVEVTAGDVLVTGIAVSGTGEIGPPGPGWIRERADHLGTNLRQVIFSKVATSAEPSSYTFGFTAKSSASAVLLDYRGVDPDAPVDEHSGRTETNSSTIVAPAVTTTGGNRLILGLFGLQSTPSNGIEPPAQMIERADVNQGAGKNKIAFEVADLILPLAGSSGDRTATSDKSGDNVGQLLALRPRTS